MMIKTKIFKYPSDCISLDDDIQDYMQKVNVCSVQISVENETLILKMNYRIRKKEKNEKEENHNDVEKRLYSHKAP